MAQLRGDAAQLKRKVNHNLDPEVVREQLDISHFSPNAVLRGAQLTLVGAHRALQNPAMFTSDHYRQAVIAVILGIAIRLVVAIPITGIKVLLWVVSLAHPLEQAVWDDSLVEGLDFVGRYVLQLPLFLLLIMRHIVPTLDLLFMQSLHWVDKTYVQKHSDDNKDSLRDMYYPNLVQYSCAVDSSDNAAHALYTFFYRFARKGCISSVVFALSYLPIVGDFVLPVASFYTFHKAAGLGIAGIIFGTGMFLPRRYLVVFLQTYFASRSLTRELLEPYFVRVRFTKTEKRNWFRSREGVLFGFGLGFYTLTRVPLLGVLIYGIAEASTAYLITKITDPPPPPAAMREYAASQQTWRNKHNFLSLSLANIDTARSKSTAVDARWPSTLNGICSWPVL